MEVKKIVLPVDFSPASREALNFVVSLARLLHPRIYVMHVVHLPFLAHLRKETEHNARQEAFSYANEKIEDFVGVKLAGEDFVKYIVDGEPCDEILRFARKRQADLIVVGTHGRKGMERFLLGSVAEKVIRDAHCPVLTVKA